MRHSHVLAVTAILLSIGILVPLTKARAEGMPEAVQKIWSRVDGKWKTEGENGNEKYTGTMTFELSPAKKCLLLRSAWKNVNTGEESTQLTIIGWDESRQVVVEHSVNDLGGTLEATHHISDETTDSWESPCIEKDVVDGKVEISESLRIIKFESPTEISVTATSRFVGGKSMPDMKTSFHR